MWADLGNLRLGLKCIPRLSNTIFCIWCSLSECNSGHYINLLFLISVALPLSSAEKARQSLKVNKHASSWSQSRLSFGNSNRYVNILRISQTTLKILSILISFMEHSWSAGLVQPAVMRQLHTTTSRKRR
jgi:hypothetical protein